MQITCCETRQNELVMIYLNIVRQMWYIKRQKEWQLEVHCDDERSTIWQYLRFQLKRPKPHAWQMLPILPQCHFHPPNCFTMVPRIWNNRYSKFRWDTLGLSFVQVLTNENDWKWTKHCILSIIIKEIKQFAVLCSTEIIICSWIIFKTHFK